MALPCPDPVIKYNGKSYKLDTFKEALLKASPEELSQYFEGIKSMPSLPFEGNYHEFVLKRLLREAASNNYAGITWVTGEQTADRYDLSKQIDALHYIKEKDGSFSFNAEKDDNPYAVVKNNVKINELEAIVGKDIAQKMINGEGLDNYKRTKDTRKGSKSLTGDNLKIGGEWAINLYDKVIPNFLSKYGKKWNAKVGEVEINKTFRSGQFDIQPNDEDGFDLIGESGELVKTFETQEDALEFANKKGTKKKGVLVHSLDITPEMQQSVLYEGQPLFNARGEEPNQIDFGVGLGQVFTNLADKVQAARMTKEFEKKNGIERNPKLKKVYREFLTSPQWFFDKEPQLQRVWDIIDKNHVRKVNEETAILKEEIWTNGKAWRKLPDNSKQRLLDELKKYEAEIYEAQNNGAKKLPFKTFEQFADQLSPEGKEFVLNTYKPLIEQAFEYVKEVDRYTIISRTPENPALEDYNSYKGNDKKEIAKLLEEAKQRFFDFDPNAEAEFENALLRQNKNPDEVKALNEAWNKNRGLRENIAEVLIDEKYKNIEGKMYFPSSRLGRKYFLSAVKKYNAPSMMPEMTPENFFTTDDRPQYLEQVKRDMQSKGYDVTIGKFAEAQEDILKNAVTQEDLLDLAILTGIETDNKVLDRLLKSVLAKGFTKHFIPKKFTPGFQYTNENFETAIDKYIGSVPYFKNRTIGNFELDDELSSLKDAGILKTGSNNDKYVQDLRNKLESRDETVGQGLRAAASVWYLSLRPSYLAQQIVQPINTLLPLLPVTAKELGLNTIEAEKAFGESMVSGITYYTWKIADKLLRLQGEKGLSGDFGLGKEFLEVIKTLEQQGVGKPLRSLEIIGEQTDPTKYYNPNPVVEGTSLFAKLLGLPGIFVEDFTRAQGIRAFYNLGKKAGLKGDNLVDFISNQIAKSYGSASGRLSKPPGYKVEGNNILSKGLRTVVESHLTFKNFAFMNYGQWGKMYRALKDDHLVRPLLYKLGAQAGIGGLKYMMWVSTVLSLLSIIYGGLDIPEDPEQQYEESFKQLNKFVPGLGDALYKGVASTTFKVDLSSLFSQQAPFITEDAAYKQNLSDALEGAPIQLAQDLYTGVTTGNTKKMLPAGIKNIVSANDYGSKGVNFGSRQIIPSDQEYEKQMKEYEKGKRNAPPVKPVDETEKTAKQLGFTPLRVSDAYQEEKSRQNKSKQLTDIVRQTVKDDIIPLIDANKKDSARKKFIDLFELVKKNGSMTDFQENKIKTVDDFISQYVINRLELRSEERLKIQEWNKKRKGFGSGSYDSNYNNGYKGSYESSY